MKKSFVIGMLLLTAIIFVRFCFPSQKPTSIIVRDAHTRDAERQHLLAIIDQISKSLNSGKISLPNAVDLMISCGSNELNKTGDDEREWAATRLASWAVDEPRFPLILKEFKEMFGKELDQKHYRPHPPID